MKKRNFSLRLCILIRHSDELTAPSSLCVGQFSIYVYPKGYPWIRQLSHVLARKPNRELITGELTDGDKPNVLPCGQDFGPYAAWVCSERSLAGTASTSEVSAGPSVNAQVGGPLQQEAAMPRSRDGSVTRESPAKRQKRRHNAERIERGVSRSTKPTLGEAGVMGSLSTGDSVQAQDETLMQ